MERPFFKFTQSLKEASRQFQEFLKSKTKLVSELGALNKQNLELEGKNRELEEGLKNSEYLSELKAGEQNPGRAALILSEYLLGPYDNILVDLGEKDGVEKNWLATAYGIYLGKVEENSSVTSKIRLASFAGEYSEGYLETLKLNISLEGIGAGNLKFILPKNLDIKVGDKIFTNTRQSYLIGQVDYIQEEQNQPLKEILVRIPLNLRELRFIELSPGR